MPDPTAIRLASEARRADLADELYSSVVEMHNLIDKAYQDERAAHRATIEQLARAGADQGADLDGLRDRYTTLDAENAALEAERDDLRVRLGSAEHKLAAAESESHRVAVAAAEVTAERDALDARVAALEAVVKAAASTLHVYVGEDFEVCRVCGIEDAKADHVDLDAYARGRDAADPVTVPAPDRAEELIIAQYDGCRKVAAELGHDGNWYAWGEWCRVNPNARSIQVEAMRRAIVGLAHGRAASPPPDASGPASDAELTALWSKTGGSVTASNRALYNHGVAYGRAKAATVPVGVAPDMDRVNMISALHAAAFDHGVACGRGKDPTEHQRREGDALDKLMAAFAYPAAKMPAGDAGFLGHDDAEVDAASVIAGADGAKET